MWPSQPKVHHNNGQIQITKVLEGDLTEYLVNLFSNVRFPCFFGLDFHGFVKTSEDELKFEFASRTTGIKFKETNNVLMGDWDSAKNAMDFLKAQTEDDIKENWLNVHANELRYHDRSGFSPDRLVCAVCYFEPLNHTVEEIFGENI